MSDDVKSRLRAVRLHFGLSQRALAKRAGWVLKMEVD